MTKKTTAESFMACSALFIKRSYWSQKAAAASFQVDLSFCVFSPVRHTTTYETSNSFQVAYEKQPVI